MSEKSLIEKISDKDVDICSFAELVVDDESLREEVINQLLTNKDIMVYYHCYYIIAKASEENPKLFYKYWDDFSSLLKHENSYHRDIGLTIIANLTKADEKDLFSILYKQYIEHFNDTKFMTGQCFVKNLKKIIKYKSEYIERVVELLLEVDNRCNYLEKQKELLKSDIIEVLGEVYEKTKYKSEIEEFVIYQSNSISPKTKKKAKEFLKRYGL